ncbi:ABC transporter permease subunit, partial [Streptomyces virginiae]|uniref:ABC transporter permease subunit n=2 Tax=Streptomyces TaxID=1883 RepID=UPI0037163906
MTDTIDTCPAGAAPAPAGLPPQAIKAVPVRHPGRWAAGTAVITLAALLGHAFSQGDVRWATVPEKLLDAGVLGGLWHTVLISVASMALGLALGVLLAVMRLSKNPVTSTIAWFYIWVFRGTPVYVQLLIWFNLALIFPILNLGFYKDE